MTRSQNIALPAVESRTAILAAAGALFAERGFNQVTIRDIAARAGLSPAMVMKCGGSKRELFYEVATIVPSPLPDVPRAELGTAMVRELLRRDATGALEPFNRALVLQLSAPGPESVRQQFIHAYLEPLTERLGGGPDARLRAELAVAALVGLAATLGVFKAPAASSRPDDVAQQYGPVVQALLDA